MSNVNAGVFNFPQILRRLGHRTKQVRDIVFQRDAIFRKSVGTHKDADGSPGGGGGRSTAMSGPPVSFGYETDDFSARQAGTDLPYHMESPPITLPDLQVYQTPIVIRVGKLERTGHRITGACNFYTPPLSVIKDLDNFSDVAAFSEIETYDTFIDVERIIAPNAIADGTYNFTTGIVALILNSATFSSDDGGTLVTGGLPGYEVDRIQFKVRLDDDASVSTLNITALGLYGFTSLGGVSNPTTESSSTPWTGTSVDAAAATWYSNCKFVATCTVPITKTGWVTVDVSVPRDIEGTLPHASTQVITSADTISKIYVGGSPLEMGKFGVAGFNLNEISGENGEGGDYTGKTGLTAFSMQCSSAQPIMIRDFKLYKACEWRVENIKDYRDEYMSIGAVRVRGERSSRRRAYG